MRIVCSQPGAGPSVEGTALCWESSRPGLNPAPPLTTCVTRNLGSPFQKIETISLHPSQTQ